MANSSIKEIVLCFLVLLHITLFAFLEYLKLIHVKIKIMIKNGIHNIHEENKNFILIKCKFDKINTICISINLSIFCGNIVIFFCQYVNKIGQEMLSKKKSEKTKVLSRRLLSITGSHPPNCINRCDNCTPCKRVIVPTHPPQSAGYYPTSWKCKCGNKLYLPQ
ncbi:hypothetical protein MtrunA17_Chr4g0019101 [Medicago truncatula]|uniref:Epidermal patterning factor-like protein n=1 Tax=Medicago truncatula TaxID=3880 RepID=A0A396I2P1_MEDTR|nr:hypothetical protein MtrunA17_Chr4g0019101 [Medicago truncatula]